MKKLFILTSLIISGSLWSDMKPLLSYLDELDEVDETSLLYLHYRCLGLMGMVANVTSGSTQENSQYIAKSSEEISVKLIKTSYMLWTQLSEDKSFEAFEENLKISVQPLADKYQILANENWLNNGAYFEGNELIVGDLTVCGQIADR